MTGQAARGEMGPGIQSLVCRLCRSGLYLPKADHGHLRNLLIPPDSFHDFCTPDKLTGANAAFKHPVIAKFLLLCTPPEHLHDIGWDVRGCTWLEGITSLGWWFQKQTQRQQDPRSHA